MVRSAVVSYNGAYAQGPGIDAPGAETQGLGPALEARSPALVRAALDADPMLGPSYLARLRSDLIPRADQDHQYKLAAAVQEEAGRVHPRWRARVLATAVDYLPGATAETTEVHDRSLRALRTAGVA